MKKIFVMAVVALMATVNAMAQHREGDITIQPRVGVTFSNVTNTSNAKMKTNVAFGVEVEHYFTDQFGLAAGVLYTNQGFKYSDDTKFNNHYCAVPITANYYVLPGLAIKAGVQPAFRVKTNLVVNGTSYDMDKALEILFVGDDDVKMNKFDLSIPVGLSYEFNGVTLDARYNFGITKLFSGVDDAMRNQVIVVTLGYKI